ncbi:hypothetical protein ACET3Z_007052 [Daucus carota]
MAGISTISPLIFSFILLSLSALSLSKSLPYQTFIPQSLPSLHPLTWDQQSDALTHIAADELTVAGEETENTLSLQLHHLDYLNLDQANASSDALFINRLTRDAGRVEALASVAAVKTNSTRTRHRGKSVSYGDGSFTVGEFSTETMTFRRNRVKNIALGCGHDNEGLFVGAAGLLGLGRGRLSFPSQAGPRFGRAFSYCLVDRSASSKPSSIIFGSSAVSRKAVFTPLISNPKLDTFYYIGLTGISVGGAPVRGVSASLFKIDAAGNGGVIIDSGTSVTRMTRPAYIAMRNAFRVGARNLKRAPAFSLFDTCFDLSGVSEVKVPTVLFHFKGANVGLPASNYLIPVDSKGTFCFAFAGTSNGLSIIGNIQQQGFRVVYDLGRSRVGFARDGCA